MKNKLFKLSLVLLLAVCCIPQVWGATQHFDGKTYIYWYKWPSAYSTWGNANIWIQMKNTSSQWTGWQSPQDAEDGWARYLVPEGDYWNIQLKTQMDGDKYTSDGGNVSSSGQTTIWNYGTNWVDYEWHTNYFARSAYVYFDNSNNMLSNSYRYILIGRDGHPAAASALLTLSKFDNTNLWYYGSLGWNNYEHLYFMANTSSWSDTGETGKSASSRVAHANKNTSNCAIMMDHSSRQYNLFVPNSANDETAVTTYSYSGYSSINSTQTLNAVVKPSTSDSYSSGTAKATISMTSYALTAATTCSKQTESLSTSETSQGISACRTATTTYVVGEVDGNYTFDGFYTAANGGTRLDSSTPGTYTFAPTSTTTVYARFTERKYNVTAVASPTAGGTVTPSSATAFGRVSGGSITATKKEGYYFTGWTGGSGTYGDASSNNTTFTPSADNQTVTANFDYTWSVKGAFPGETAFNDDHLLENVGKNASNKDTCKIVMNLPANTSMDFKILARDVADSWWSCSTHEDKAEFTYASHAVQTCYQDNSNKNMILTTAGAGDYTFAWNITDKKIMIIYPTSYYVTAAVTPAGKGTVSPSSATYFSQSEGANIVASDPANGYEFTSWEVTSGSGTIADDESATTNFKPSATATVTATFSPKKYTLTLNAEDATTAGTASVQATFDANTLSATITNPKRTDYLFAGWYDDEECEGTQVIDAAGALCASAGSYTNASREWVYYSEEEIDLYAKWISLASLETTCWSDDGNGGYTWNCDYIAGFDTPKPSATTWSTASNWGNGSLPTLATKVVLTHDMTVDDTHAKAKEIVLNDVELTIGANKGLEVAGTITKADGSAPTVSDLILESSSAGNATLIFDNSNSAAATVQMYSKASVVGNTWNWQYMAPAFTNANALYDYYGCNLYKWDGGWQAVPTGATLNAFAGYCITNKSGATTYNTDGTLVPTTSHSVTLGDDKDMVIGNSWTAPIYIGGFTASTFTSTPLTIYLFNTGSAPNGSSKGTGPGTYETVPVKSAEYTGNELIAPLQAFFVTTVGGSGGTITMNYDELVRTTTNDHSVNAGPMHAPKRVNEEEDPEVMKIWAIGAEYSDRLVILEREDFTTGFDNGWDGEKKSFSDAAPSVYVIAETEKDAVSAVPDYEGTILGFLSGIDTQCTMNFDYNGEENWYLNDLKEEKSTLITNENSYSFSCSSTDAETRFVISKSPIHKTPTGIDNVTEGSNARKQMINGTLYIIRDGRIYNAEGALVK